MIFRRRDDEGGAILAMTAFIVVVVIGFTAFAVDLGMQRVVRSDMQSLANVVALDMSRYMKGRTRQAIEADPGWDEAKARSVQRNDSTVGADPTVTAVLGTINETTGAFVEVPPSGTPTAVKVIAGSSIDFTFVGGSGAATRSAIASLEAGVCFSVGAFAAQLDTGSGTLTSLLSDIVGVDVTALGSGGIVELRGATVPLLGIATELGVGTAEELVALPGLTVADFLTATATVLNDEGETAAANVLNLIVTNLQLLPGPEAPLDVASILNLSAGGGNALDLGIDAFDLVTGALFVAGEGQAIGVPNLAVSLPLGLADIELELTIIAPPVIACGGVGTVAHSAQVKVNVEADVLGGVIGAVLALLVSDLELDVTVEAASADGTLTAMECGANGADSITIRTESSILEDLALVLSSRVLLLGRLDIARIDLNHALSGTTLAPVTLTYPPLPSTELPYASVPSELNELGLDTMTLTLLGVLPLGSLLSPLLGALDPILFAVVQPILNLVGLSLGGADIAATSRVICDSPSLLG